jgi:amino acid adenylation domain-containing protein
LWTELLRSDVATPEARVDELQLLSALDQSRIVSDWNATTVDFGDFEPIYAAFVRRATETPDWAALECDGVRWSARDLAEYAQGLAERLIEEGLQPGGLVGVCVPRSPQMAGALLAVMMAGGAYVPLDPRHPHERLEMALADSGAKLLLTMQELGLKTAAKTLNISRRVPPKGAIVLPSPVGAEALAYVIYTSGSTGVPKGVAIQHGALMNLLRSMQREPGLDANDVLVAITTPAFDIAALELLLPLFTGAKLVIATDTEVQDGHLLLQLLERTGATVLQATPGAWRILIDTGWTHDLPLKALCGGEALPRELADKLLDRAGEVWNMYGPTEATIWSSATRVTRGTGSLHLGSPIANTRFYILDERRRPAPIGVTGELYIGGKGLARGYWNRPELTTEKFISETFTGTAQRIYATGDLARRHEDGSIALLGRTDFQVKIRGYRIELAEIEAAITQHAQVKETVVTQHKETNGTNRLVAYVATGFGPQDSRATILAKELPALLSKKLPEYMVPGVFVVLELLPHNANGKIDRKALPAPNSSDRAGRKLFTPATTPAQKLLAGIWADVLDLSAVSVTDSIFELGADSLLIFRIAARAQREGIAVSAAQIFQQRTIAGICDAMEEQRARTPLRLTTRIAAASRDVYRVSREKVDA